MAGTLISLTLAAQRPVLDGHHESTLLADGAGSTVGEQRRAEWWLELRRIFEETALQSVAHIKTKKISLIDYVVLRAVSACATA